MKKPVATNLEQNGIIFAVAEACVQALQATARRQRQFQCGNHLHLKNCSASGSCDDGITDDLHLLHVIAPLRAGMVLLRETMLQRNHARETL